MGNSSWQRHDHARCPSRNTAIASFAHTTEQATGHQPQDGGEVVKAHDDRGFEDRAGEWAKLGGFAAALW